MSCLGALSHLVRRRAAPPAPASCASASTSTLVSAYTSEKASLAPSAPPRVRDTGAQLAALRKLMDEEGVTAYLVPSEDAHGSEYVASEDERRAFISGFTGSTGTAVVCADSAHLFTDGRYFVQAEEQLDDSWTLHKVGEPGVLDWSDWLVGQAEDKPLTLGLDARLSSYTAVGPLVKALADRNSAVHYPTRNLVDVCWHARPPPSLAPIYAHDIKYAGVAADEKLARVAAWLGKRGSAGNAKTWPKGSAYFVSELDEVAWLLNLRGGSFAFTPLFPAYLVIAASEGGKYRATLFVSPLLLLPSSKTRKYVEGLDVEVREYDDVFRFLRSGEWKGAPAEGSDLPKLVMSSTASFAAVNAVGEENVALQPLSPIATWKARKNAAELAGMHAAYRRDGAAWVRWAAWLEEAIVHKGKAIDEWTAAKELHRLRTQDPLYAGTDAYPSISASGEDAALPHFETPEDGTARIIDRETPYLMDAGGQYYDGTIDTTRTTHFGKPSAEQKRAYTRVLQGHIAIAEAVFPMGTTGAQLDVLARNKLWQDGYNYMHGTGHGIGAFSQVHEGPQGFGRASGAAMVPAPLDEGMCISDEPGHYEAGKGGFGIRIESIFAVAKAHTHRGFGGADRWLRFERITQVPIDRRLVDHKLLNSDELRWLTHHNESVRRALLPLIKHDRRAVKYLQKQ